MGATGEKDQSPAVYDHLRPAGDADAPVDPGVYRVVGTAEDTVTLLRVGDTAGRRVATGEVVSVDRDAFGALEPADNPDGSRPLGERAAGAVELVVWSLRAFAQGLLARPIASLVAVGLLVVGHQGDRVLAGPETAFTVVYLLGVGLLVYLGSRGG